MGTDSDINNINNINKKLENWRHFRETEDIRKFNEFPHSERIVITLCCRHRNRPEYLN